jgi:hypothetical protein
MASHPGVVDVAINRADVARVYLVGGGRSIQAAMLVTLPFLKVSAPPDTVSHARWLTRSARQSPHRVNIHDC